MARRKKAKRTSHAAALLEELYTSPVPEWCQAADQLPKLLKFGARGTEGFEGFTLAQDVWGAPAEADNSGFTAFAYLWRRFGPPFFGSDPHKDLCQYFITTPMPDVFLSLSLSGSPISYAVGFIAPQSIREEVDRPRMEWFDRMNQWFLENDQPNIYEVTFVPEKYPGVYERALKAVGNAPDRLNSKNWAEMSGPMGDLNRAVAAAMLELLRPVYIRDVPLTLFGCISDADAGRWEHVADQSRYAGYGMSQTALVQLMKEDAVG